MKTGHVITSTKTIKVRVYNVECTQRRSLGVVLKWIAYIQDTCQWPGCSHGAQIPNHG